MKKIVLFTLSAVLSIAFTASTAMAADLVDGNCGVGLKDDDKKPNRYIAAYDGHFNKTKMLMFKVSGNTVRTFFNDNTKWEFPKDAPAKSKEELAKKKGSCIAVDFVEQDNKQIAVSVKVLPEFKLDPKMIIKLGEVKALIAKGAILVDSRPGPVFSSGTIPNSINITLPKIKTDEGIKMLPADKNAVIIMYCGGFHCKLSPQSAAIAQKAGYKNVKVYHAGYPDWAKTNASEVQASFVKGNIDKENPMVLIDIRKDAAEKHIPGAIAINSSMIYNFKAQFPKEKNALIVVYGADNKDVKDAVNLADKITAWGYTSVSYINNGFAAYEKAGGKTEKNKLAKTIKYVPKPSDNIAENFIADYLKGAYKDSVFIDVREKSEISEEPGATLLGAKVIPLGELENNLPPKNNKYVMFCASGARAQTGYEILKGKDFKNVLYFGASIESDDMGGLKMGEKPLTAEQIKKMTK